MVTQTDDVLILIMFENFAVNIVYSFVLNRNDMVNRKQLCDTKYAVHSGSDISISDSEVDKTEFPIEWVADGN